MSETQRELAKRSAELFGVAYLVNGVYAAPEHVEVFHATITRTLQSLKLTRDEASNLWSSACRVSGVGLDAVGERIKEIRIVGETDMAYRRRLFNVMRELAK